jgi:hypothetical protein
LGWNIELLLAVLCEQKMRRKTREKEKPPIKISNTRPFDRNIENYFYPHCISPCILYSLLFARIPILKNGTTRPDYRETQEDTKGYISHKTINRLPMPQREERIVSHFVVARIIEPSQSVAWVEMPQPGTGQGTSPMHAQVLRIKASK